MPEKTLRPHSVDRQEIVSNSSGSATDEGPPGRASNSSSSFANSFDSLWASCMLRAKVAA